MSSIVQVSLELDIFPDSASQWDYLIEIIIEIYNWDYRYAPPPPQARLQYFLMELDWWELTFGNEETLFHVELTTRVIRVDSLCPIPPTRPTMACLARDLLRKKTKKQNSVSVRTLWSLFASKQEKVVLLPLAIPVPLVMPSPLAPAWEGRTLYAVESLGPRAHPSWAFYPVR